MHEGRFAEADSAASDAIAMDSTFMLAWTWRGNALLAMSRYPEALLRGRAIRRPSMDDTIRRYVYSFRTGKSLDSIPGSR